MNLQKLVVSLAVAGVMVSPLSQAGVSVNQQSKAVASVKAKAAKAQSDLFFINKIVTLDKAYDAVAAKSSGRLLGASINLDYGAPNYEFMLNENGKLKHIVVSAETGAVISEELMTADTLTLPSVTLTQAISEAESATTATAFSAELQQDEKHAAFHVATGSKDADYEVTVSATTGKAILAVKEAMEAETGEGDGSNTTEPTLVPLSQAITAAQAAVSGTVISVGLDMMDDMMDDMEGEWDDEGGEWDDEGGEWDDEGGDWDDEGGDWDDEGGEWDDEGGDDEGGEGQGRWDDWDWLNGDKDNSSKAQAKNNKDDQTQNDDQAADKPSYMVEIVEGDYIHVVKVDATTGTVTEVQKDPEQAMQALITAQTTWAATATVIKNAKAAQAGHFEGIALTTSEDGKSLIYVAYIEAADKSYVVSLKVSDGSVIKVDTIDWSKEDGEGEGSSGGNTGG